MKRIGLIGGLSPESTIHYYQILCHEYNRWSDGLNSPEMVIVNLNLQDLVTLFDTTRIHAEAILELALREQTIAKDEEEPPEPFSPVCYLKEFKPEEDASNNAASRKRKRIIRAQFSIHDFSAFLRYNNCRILAFPIHMGLIYPTVIMTQCNKVFILWEI